MSQAQKNLRGIVAMTLAMAFFALNDALVKLARVHWDTGQILVSRGVFALVILTVWLALARLGGQLPLLRHPKLLLRGVIEGFVACAFIAALGAIPLAEITTILMLAPMIITALSTVFFGEKVGWRRWSAVGVGFSGISGSISQGHDCQSCGLRGLPTVPHCRALGIHPRVRIHCLTTRRHTAHCKEIDMASPLIRSLARTTLAAAAVATDSGQPEQRPQRQPPPLSPAGPVRCALLW